MKIFGQLSEVVKVVFRLSSSKEVKLEVGAQDGASTDRTFKLPPVDTGVSSAAYVGELVEKDLAQTLTNKTIDGDSNTLQDIPASSIKTVLADAEKVLVRDAAGAVTSTKIDNDNVDAAAAIAYSKLALSNSIVDGDISTTTTIQDSKLATISTAGKVSGSAITSGTIGGTTSVNTSGTITASTLAGTLTNSAITGATSLSYNIASVAPDGNYEIPSNGGGVLRITSGTQLKGIKNFASGKTLIVINESGSDITIYDQSPTTADAGIYIQGITGGTAIYTFPENSAMVFVYDDNSSQGPLWYPAGGGGGGSGSGTSVSLQGAASGYAVGTPVYLSGTAVVSPASATSTATAEVVGMVQQETSSGIYKVALYGSVSGVLATAFESGSYPTAGSPVFLSTTTGKLSASEPATIGEVSLPLGIYVASDVVYFTPKRGAVVGGTNARTQLNLTSSATTDIFNAAAPTLYQAGELTGWVKLGNSQKFYFRAPFAQNGAETNWNISPSYVGDTPPAGFSLQMNSSGVISITCPSFAGAGLVNYALNAPAVGATFPLNISAARITQDTIAEARLPSTYSGLLTLNGGAITAGLTGANATTVLTTGSGKVGEYKVANPATTVAFGVNGAGTTITSISLNPGLYVLNGMVRIIITSGAATNYYSGISTIAGDYDSLSHVTGAAATINGPTYAATGLRYVNVLSTTTYYLIASINYTTIPGGNYTTQSFIQAVRIA